MQFVLIIIIIILQNNYKLLSSVTVTTPVPIIALYMQI